MAAAFSALRSAFAGISPRERRLLTFLGVGLGVLLFFGLYLWSSSALDELETERSQTVDALRLIRNERSRIRARQQRREQMLARYATRAPPLGSFIEGAARAANVQINEATDMTSPPPTDGRRFQRRAVSVRLRRVDLQSLANFMDRVEAAPFPIAITSVRIRRRFGESNSYDVDDMVIATWDRVEPAARTTRGTGAGGGGGGSASNGNNPRGDEQR